jgi:hypothetical protein
MGDHPTHRRIDVTGFAGLAISLALTATVAVILVQRVSFNARATPATATVAGTPVYGPADSRSRRRLARLTREVGHWFDYTYEWNGRTHLGHDCTPDAPGPTVEVLVDPHDPSMSATQPRTTGNMTVLLAFSALLVLVFASRVDWRGLRGEPADR